eukprot:CAMPEP_0116128276 /NCGR_PEP_ID=MMETSP0329-20121206/7275_1 /TAXON_ID=697910 /ORGANISM="Pseudo-nitzschia arenysensis, Strain B593" /LENGTH=555 /DNA_ID=CAMNT_0003622407 /DNA_START=129 /DNA_END=1796 /DNA_ORIENTATION=+
MIQRRTVGMDPPNASVENSHQNGSATAKTTRKRRVRRNGASRKNGRWLKGLSRILEDEDALIALIQVVSIVIIFGCSVTLALHFFGRGEIIIGDDDEDSSNSWINSILAVFLGKNMRHKLHRDHENSGETFTRKDGTEFDILTPSSIYTIPGSMPHIGDKSDYYASLRKEYDSMDLPKVEQRYKFKTRPMEGGGEESPAPYDIHNCPEHPPENYPYAWNLLELLDHWPPDKTDVPEDNTIFQGICVFDFEKDYDKALNYRKKEVPFVVSNDPAVQDTAKRWMAPGYIERLMADVKHRTEYSETNHFMYWNAGAQVRREQGISKAKAHYQNAYAGDGHPDGRGVDKDLAHWQQPTKMMRMPYREWLSHANLTEGESVGPHDPHYYYRLIGCGEDSPKGGCDKGSSEYLFDELTFFQPKENLYIVDPKQQKGIHCRFGMNGVIAENHFDMSRNAIAVMGGERRYVLSHPKQCQLLSLLPKGHPSARHSAVDWSDPDLESYPEFAQAEANEIVLQAGDVLYLPTNWFHFIVSLNLNFQCNTRSGVTPDYFKPMRACGF